MSGGRLPGTVPARVFDPERLRAVARTGLLDTAAEEAFDRLASVATAVTGAPLAFITLVDDRRSFWKACIGVEATDPAERQNAVEASFCQYVVDLAGPLVVTDAVHDPRTADNPAVATMGVRAWAGYPIHSPEGQILGSFCAVDTVSREWTTTELGVLETLAMAASGEIALREVAEQAGRQATALQEQVDRSAALVRTLQESLLPAALPAVRGMDVAARFVAALHDEVLGDFYDLFQISATRWGFTLGDVSGKGVQAAKVTALARHTIRAAAMYEDSPAGVLAALNASMLTQRPHGDEGFLTVAYATVETAGGDTVVRLASGGHTPVLLLGEGGAVRAVGHHGLPLGLFPDAGLVDVEVVVAPDDVLVLYSDGVTEARRGPELFGEDRLRAVLSSSGRATAEELVGALAAAVDGFAESAPATDDIAILAVRFGAA